MAQRRYTKRRWLATSVRLDPQDRELIYLTAAREGVSQSALVRAAVREYAARKLAAAPEAAGR
jgi:predicted HicB family RNase H-like nuclease